MHTGKNTEKHPIQKIELDLTGTGKITFHSRIENQTLHFFNPHYPDRKSFNKAWMNSSLGKKIYRMFTDSYFLIPEKVRLLTISVSRHLVVESTIDEDILNFVRKSCCSMGRWKVRDDAIQIKLSNVNPMELIGAIAASIRRNEMSLRLDMELLDIGSMEKIPEIKRFEEEYIHQFIDA